MPYKTVEDAIKDREEIFVIYDDFTLQKAAERMEKWQVRAAVVFSAVTKKVCGVFSQSDSFRATAQGRLPDLAKVREFMSAEIISVNHTDSLSKCEDLMISKNIYHLVVFRNGELAGLISRRDVDRLAKEEAKEEKNLYKEFINRS